MAIHHRTAAFRRAPVLTTRAKRRRKLLLVPLLSVAAIPAFTSSASAATGTVNTAGAGLTVRSGPGSSFAAIDTRADGAKITIVCQTTGSTVTGTYGTSRIWDKIAAGGYVADAYVYTGSDSMVAPPCTSGSSGTTPIVNDYPYKSSSWSQADPWNFYKRECVSFVAWRLRQYKVPDFNNHWRGVHWGNANNWDNAARSIGLVVDHRPAAGAVAQWNSGSFGHVAFVARVHADGTVTLEEYNKGGTHNYSTRRVDASAVENYIHF